MADPVAQFLKTATIDLAKVNLLRARVSKDSDEQTLAQAIRKTFEESPTVVDLANGTKAQVRRWMESQLTGQRVAESAVMDGYNAALSALKRQTATIAAIEVKGKMDGLFDQAEARSKARGDAIKKSRVAKKKGAK